MAEITKNNPRPAYHVSPLIWALLAILGLLAFFLGLSLPLMGPDEPRYAEVAREMFNRGDWVTPTLGGYNWFEKPALLYWAQMLSYRAFGVNEFAARFGPAVFGILTVASLWLLGYFVSEEKKANGPRTRFATANWFALIAASTIGIIAFAHGASFDIILTFPLTASLVCFYIYDRRGSAGNDTAILPLIGFYIFIGVGLLAKGLVGAVFPAATVALYFLLARRMPSRRLIVSFLWGGLIALGVAALWYLPMYARHGYGFFYEFIVQHHFERYTSNKYQHPQPFHFFLIVLPLLTIPWLPLFFAAVYRYLPGRFRRDAGVRPDEDDTRVTQRPLYLFAFAWVLVPLVFFSFSGSKLPGYILPAVPGTIIISSLFIVDLVSRSRIRSLAVLAVAALTFLSVIGIIFLEMPRFAATDSVKPLIEAAAQKGFETQPVLCLNTLSHNAEYYAAGRLIRDGDGKQHRFADAQEIENFVASEPADGALVLVPLNAVSSLTGDAALSSDVVSDNTELAIVLVKKR